MMRESYQPRRTGVNAAGPLRREANECVVREEAPLRSEPDGRVGEFEEAGGRALHDGGGKSGGKVLAEFIGKGGASVAIHLAQAECHRLEGAGRLVEVLAAGGRSLPCHGAGGVAVEVAFVPGARRQVERVRPGTDPRV